MFTEKDFGPADFQNWGIIGYFVTKSPKSSLLSLVRQNSCLLNKYFCKLSSCLILVETEVLGGIHILCRIREAFAHKEIRLKDDDDKCIRC
jgi:hypothetical protein